MNAAGSRRAVLLGASTALRGRLRRLRRVGPLSSDLLLCNQPRAATGEKAIMPE
jgi:hypothetical protein